MAEIGYQLSSITPFLDTQENIRDSFRKLADIGYRHVQLQGVPACIPNEVIVEALEESGLNFVATQEDYALGFGDDPQAGIDRAVAVGAKYLVCALMPKTVDSPESLEEFAADLTCIADDAKAAGLIFAFHPIGTDYREMDGQPVYLRLMNLLPDHVQLTFCVAAAHAAGVDPAEVFERFAGRMDLVHFKDTAEQPDGSEHMMPLGQGSHDWSPILKAADEAGAKYVFAEQERWLKDAFECAAESHAYLTSIR